MVDPIPLDKFYLETYNLGCAAGRVEVYFDFDNWMLYFRPVRMTGSHPINDLPEEERVKMPKQPQARKFEVQRMLRILKDEMHAACQRYGMTHDYDIHPNWRYQ